MKGKKIFKDLLQLSEEVQLFFEEKDLIECKLFLQKTGSFWEHLPKLSKKRKKTVKSYLTLLWGKKIPFLTLFQLKLLKKRYYDVQIDLATLGKNAFLTPDNYVLTTYNEQKKT